MMPGDGKGRRELAEETSQPRRERRQLQEVCLLGVIFRRLGHNARRSWSTIPTGRVLRRDQRTQDAAAPAVFGARDKNETGRRGEIKLAQKGSGGTAAGKWDRQEWTT